MKETRIKGLALKQASFLSSDGVDEIAVRRGYVSAKIVLFELREAGVGHFALAGELSFASAGIALKKTARMFAARDEVVFDLAGIVRADSAGLALLLEWQRRAKEAGIKLRYVNLPPQLQAIARVVGVDDILSID